MRQTDTPADPLVGQLLDGRYRVEALIGSGGMGKVYRATREMLGKLVAIKTLELEVKASERTELVERFTREAQATAAIRHENVVEIIDFGQTEDCVYFVMELLEGYVLADVIGRGRSIEPARLVPLAVQIANGLHAAHVLGIVHRDVKPSNVFISPTREGEERVKILDFGLAKVSDGLRLTRAGMIFGTASYMSPEQARGASLDARTDIYSLGCLLFEALVGRPPFVGESFMEIIGQQLQAPVPRLAELRPGIELPTGLEGVIGRALAKDASARFSSMEELVRAMASIEVPPPPRIEVARTVPSASPAPSQARKRGVAERHPVLTLLAFLYITQSHSTDDELAPSELKLIAQQLHAWRPMTTIRQLEAIIAHARAEYEGLGTREARLSRKHEVVEALRGRLSEDQRRHVLGSMWRIAGADGQIIDAEREFIADTIAQFNDAEPEPEPAPSDDDDAPDETTERIAPMFETGPLPVMEPEPHEPTRLVPPVFDPAVEEPHETTERVAPVFGAEPHEPTRLIAAAFVDAPQLTLPDPVAAPPSPDEPSATDDVARPPESIQAEFGFSSDVVREHFERCRLALTEILEWDQPLATLAEGPITRWRDSASVLGLESVGAVWRELVAVFEDPARPPEERRTAALLLLELDPKRGAELLLDHAASSEVVDASEPVILALELGGNDKREQLLLRGHNQARAEYRSRWLHALERKLVDPGPDVVSAALASENPDTLAAGLRLLRVHVNRGEHERTILPHLFARASTVRSAAITAGLVLGLPQTPLLAGQTARIPGMFACTYLHALEASSEQLEVLVELAEQDHAPPDIDLALALCGRPRALAAVIRRHNQARSARTLAGIRFTTGFDGPAEELSEWWSQHAPEFADEPRYILGRAASSEQFLAGLRVAPNVVWDPLRLELLVRSQGTLRLPARGLPDVLLAAVEAIDPTQLSWL